MLLPEFENKGIGLFEMTEAAVPAGTAAFAFKSAAHDLSACSTHDSVKTVRCAKRVKKTLNSVFFTPELCAAGRPKAPLIPSEKSPISKTLYVRFSNANFSSYTCGACVDALASGMSEKIRQEQI